MITILGKKMGRGGWWRDGWAEIEISVGSFVRGTSNATGGSFRLIQLGTGI